MNSIFFDQFNGLDAAEILSRVELAVAKDNRSYVCPNCGHGKGGDGIKPRVTSKGQTRWKCFGCGTDFSNFDLAGAVLGLNPEYDKAELARRLEELFGLDNDKKSARSNKKISGSVDTMANEKTKSLPAGGYVCKIVAAEFGESKAGNDMLTLHVDIAEGEFAGYFQAKFNRAKEKSPNATWSRAGTYHHVILGQDGQISPYFKGLVSLIEQSNPGFVWYKDGGLEEADVVGKLCGFVFDAEERTTADDKLNSAIVAKLPKTVDDIRSGNFVKPATNTSFFSKETEPEPRNFAPLYEFCRGKWSLRKFVDEQGGTWRGLTFATLDKAGCLYHGAYNFGDKERPAVIFPYSERFYFVRSVVDKERRVPKDAKRELYIAAPIVTDGVNFVSEAEIDALSIAQVMPSCGSVATGGTGGARLLVTELNKRFGDAECKPRFVVLLDNDKGGKDNAPEFVKALRSAGYPASFSFLEGGFEGERITNSAGEVTVVKKVDANDLLVAGKLVAHLIDVIERTEDELAEPITEPNPEPAKTDEPAQVDATDDGASFGRSIGDYFTERFFDDVALSSRYAVRKTGFDNLDEKLVFVPGLYLLGGLPATGKTTFVWQMLNQLAERGEHCIFCSYEMSELELFTKSLARKLYLQDAGRSERMGLTSFNIRRGMVTHHEEVQAAVKSFSFSKVNLRVAELSNEPVKELFERLKPLVDKADKSPVVVLDYLQILPATKGSDGKRESIDDTLRRLKDFQRSTASTFVVISSFNRANYWARVSFESFKESGGIEYSADAVLGLETCVKVNGGNNELEERKRAITAAYKQDTRQVKLTCLKNRNGSAFDVVFDYHCKFDCFESAIDEDELPPKREVVSRKGH